ncbi:hypothetical protein LINGRAHAP2_LOCUS34568, partial [Linum grandiflorum]
LEEGESSTSENHQAKGQPPSEWYLDSGCSHHMTGDVSLFSKLTYKLGGKVTFGDNSKRKNNWFRHYRLVS